MRLRPTTAALPKALLPIGGRPLISHSLDRLARAGVDETIIVTGHCGETVRERVGARWRGMAITYVHNPDFETTGSMVSLMLAAEAVRASSILLLECDLLFDARFIAAALEDGRDDVLLAAEVSGSGDEVYLCAGPDGRLSFLGKDAPPDRRRAAVGELAGISRLSRRLLATYGESVRRHLTNGSEQRHYEEVLFQLAQGGWPIRVRACPGLVWAEIDTPADLARAEMQVWPALREAEGGSNPA